MWKDLTKELAIDLKSLSKKFTSAFQASDKSIDTSSSDAQAKLTEMFRELRNSQDNQEIDINLGKHCSLGYFQKANTSSDDFNLFKQQKSSFVLNEELRLRDCANAVFHSSKKDFSIDGDGKHWLMYITDRNQLVIMDIQKVCDVIIANT